MTDDTINDGRGPTTDWRRPATLLCLSWFAATSIAQTAAANLPVPCAAGSCGVTGPSVWVSSGTATATQVGNALTINQTSNQAVFNWATFDIAAAASVDFRQPSASSLALNRIFQSDPTHIFGTLTANGQVYLLNQNGIIFGPHSRVNVNSLLASTLTITDDALAKGILSNDLLGNNQPAFTAALDANGKPISGSIIVNEGAQIATPKQGGGRIVLLGEEVDNSGSLSSPGGQVILAAGQKAYLQASDDVKLRGLVVEVDGGGTVWNRLNGSISASTGNVTLLGLAVNQDGRISATTSVAANGSIILRAADTHQVSFANGHFVLDALNGGTLELGEHSVTSVLPDSVITDKAVDSQVQNPSTIDLVGRNVHLAGGSEVVAKGGEISLLATANPFAAVTEPLLSVDPGSQLRIDDGARIDASGSDATLPMSANIVAVQLRGNELRDSPQQRNGALRGQTVYVDSRIGTTIGDVRGAIDAVAHSVEERTSAGGKILIKSQGDAVLAPGATLDVSGGKISYEGGVIATTQLVTADGRVVDIGTADPNLTYTGLINPTVDETHFKWGVVDQFSLQGSAHYEDGYVRGQNAGTVQIAGRSLVVNGTLLGNAYVGAYQRDAAHRPLGGQLIIGDPNQPGSDNFAPSVEFHDGVVPIVVAPGTPLAGLLSTLILPTDYLTQGGFTRTVINSNGRILIPAGLSLDLPAFSSFSLRAPRIESYADIRSPASSLQFTSVGVDPSVLSFSSRPGIKIGAQVTMDVSGRWINDFPGVSAIAPTDPLALNGGSIGLNMASTAGELVIGNGVHLDVSSGAYVSSAGTTTAGSAGSILLAAATDASAIDLGADLNLAGYGINGGAGGSLRIVANRIEVGHSSSAWSAQRVDFNDPSARAFELSDSLFSSGGFSNFTIGASGAKGVDAAQGVVQPLVIASQVDIHTVVSTRLIDADALYTQRSGTSIASLSNVAVPPDYLRAPTTLAFNLYLGGGGVAGAATNVDTLTAGDLIVSSGARIQTDAGSSISFNAPTHIRFAGTAIAPAGSISMTLATPAPRFDVGYDPAQGIYLEEGSLLDVSGAAVLTPSSAGLRSGTVLNGGAVTLSANRGSVFAQHGSRIDLSGTNAVLDLTDPSGSGVFVPTNVASAGGTLSISAPESIELKGTLSATAGNFSGKAGPAGGSLSLTLGRNNGYVAPLPDAGVPPSPDTPRTLLVSASPQPVDVRVSTIDPLQLRDDGFDSLSLASDDIIQLAAGTPLAFERSISLQAPNLMVQGSGNVEVKAPVVTLGPTNVATQAVTATNSGLSVLSVDANLIELNGNLSLHGFGATHLNATESIRVVGALAGKQLIGSLAASGDLQMTAREIYPSTLSQYTISVPNGALSTHSAGTARPVLSAGGSLTLSAATIDHQGSIEAPFGHIDFQADRSLVLGAGSLVSTSGQGQIIPFGSTQNGTSWVYSLNDALQVPVLAPPDKRVGLTAPSVEIASGATVDISGGGDLYAYEFLPGLGGSKDVLAPGVAPNSFAIVPQITGYAPVDAQYYLGSSVAPGDAVYLSGIPGQLPAGTYAILPARYALLPGAFLVTAVSGQTDLPAGLTASRADGTTIISGYRTTLNTTLRDSRTSGFAIRPGSDAHRLAQYDDSYAGTFFAAAAKKIGKPVPALPVDAGTLALNVVDDLILNGTINSKAASGGRGAVVDLSADHLQIVTTATAATGVVQVTASSLESLGAQSLLIGGTRSTTEDGTNRLTVTAQDVTVVAGTTLSAPEVLLSAQDQVSVERGARITAESAATGQGGGPLIVDSSSGASALLRVSTGAQVDLTRPSVNSSAGTVEISEGAVLSAPGSITLSATRDAHSNGTFEAGGGSVSLEASRISLGDGVRSTAGLVLTNAQLDLLSSVADLRLISQSTIDLYGGVALGSRSAGKASLGSLTLNAGEIRGFGTGGDVAHLTAGSVSLGNAGAVAAPTLATGRGALDIESDSLTLGAGHYGFSGFDDVKLGSLAEITASGRSEITAQGNLTMQGTRIIGQGGADVLIDATGHTVRTLAAVVDPKRPVATPGLGVRFAIDAAAIDLNAPFILPSGQLAMTAERDVSLNAGSVLDVAGVVSRIGGIAVNTPGGSVSLSAGGNVIAAEGSRVNLSGAGNRDAGTLSIDAGGVAELNGTLQARAAAGADGGSLILRTGSEGELSSLAAVLDEAGFSRRQDITVTNGDLTLAAGGTVRARDVSLTAEGGSLLINGTVDARASEPGRVQLNARNDLTLGSTAAIRAGSSGAASRGGDVELNAAQGTLSTASGSLIDASGAAGGGTVVLRASANGGDVAIGALDGQVTGAGAVIARVVHAYDGVTVVDDALKSVIATDLADFNTTAATVTQRLDAGGRLPLQVQAAVEVQSTGDMTVASAWDLAGFRPNGQAGELTLRAGGTLNLAASVSDGFADLGAGVVPLDASGWSYRLVGGASLASANPDAVLRAKDVDAASGNILIGTGTTIRSSTGSIALNAAHDIVFADQSSVVYTSGRPVLERTPFVDVDGTFNWNTGGGDIRLNAGRDILGAISTQMITEWQLRRNFDTRVPDSRTQWGIDFSRFQENVGALGGGNVSVHAARDVLNLSAMIPTTGDVDPLANTLSVFGGGNLEVSAGRDLSSGVFYVGRGRGDIAVGRSMVAGREVNGSRFGTVLALGDGSFDVVAGNDLTLQTVLNPTVIGQPVRPTARKSYFLTYSDASSASLTALSGSVNLLNDHGTFQAAVGNFVGNNTPTSPTPAADKWYPGIVSVAALDGDINVGGDFWLFPSARGNLDLLARDAITLTSGDLNALVVESGIDASKIPTPLNPGRAALSMAQSVLGPLATLTTLLHVDDPDPIHLIAENGDINGGIFNFAEPARLVAGRDIIAPNVVGQNFHATDVTLLQAGRDITYAGAGNTGQLTLGGPGNLDLIAGRDINLGTSVGISTLGATANTALPTADGAGVNILAGLGKQPDYQAFVSAYLVDSDTYASKTTAYMRSITGNQTLSPAAALAAFQKLPSEQQLPLILKVFFDELKLAGREANANKKPGYSRGFTAINTLFPGSVKADGSSVDAADLPYKGNLELAFSRIYTLAGGDINLLLPGGLINVGLAVPPANAPIREPSQLGIVTQGTGSVDAFTYGDVLVNQSRVFTLGGGGIVIWSSAGNIDAGRGAKTAISAPAPVLLVKDDGSVSVEFGGAVAGSGIRTILTQPGVEPGDVDLIAPVGTVNAGDAGIGSAGNINIAAQTVVGADNINFGGTATGVPASTSNLAAGLTGASNTASNSSGNAAAGASGANAAEKSASVADAALSWLDVFVTGLGEENCKQDDMECLKRQKKN